MKYAVFPLVGNFFKKKSEAQLFPNVKLQISQITF